MRKLFKSLPDAILRNTANAWLSSILKAEAICRNGSSGRWTSGMQGGALQQKWHAINLLKVEVKIWRSKKKKNHKHAYGKNESRNRSQKALKLQVPNAYFLMKVRALAHRNKIASARIKVWQTKVSRWYSNNSKRTQIAVAPPSTPAEIFLFLHKKTSAAAINQFNKYSGTQREEQTTGLNNTIMLSRYIYFLGDYYLSLLDGYKVNLTDKIKTLLSSVLHYHSV